MEICISIFLGILSCIYLAWSRWFLSYLFNNFELGLSFIWGFSGGSDGKESACDEGNPASIPGSGRSHGERHGNPSRTLAWRISRTEEPGGLQSMRLQRAGHNWASNTFTLSFIQFSIVPGILLEFPLLLGFSMWYCPCQGQPILIILLGLSLCKRPFIHQYLTFSGISSLT